MSTPSDDTRNEDLAAIRLAQQSIDVQSGDPPDEPGIDPATAIEVAQLASALDVLGRFQVGAAPAEPGEASDPLTIGRFEILGERGRGGFGIVLQAFDPGLQRTVALKVPRPERLLAGHPAADFIREAQLAARLDHPGIVPVYEAQQHGPVWYIASAYCDGPTLGEWLEHDPCKGRTRRAVVDILAQIAEAVQFAHTHGVLHLDLQPENVLLDLDHPGFAPRAMVNDFGLAGTLDGPSPAKQGRVAGTPAFMAPEQRSGHASQIGVATDVYGLGAILNVALRQSEGPERTGVPPLVRGGGPATSLVSRDLEAIAARCTQTDPNERYGSAGEVAADLRRALRGEEVTARPLGVVGSKLRVIRKRPAAVAVATLSVAALMGGAVRWGQQTEAVQTPAAHQVAVRGGSGALQQSLVSLSSMALAGSLAPGPIAARLPTSGLADSILSELREWSESTGCDEDARNALWIVEQNLGGLGGRLPGSDQEFCDGVSAWVEVIRQNPAEPLWRRALVVHLFAYTRAAKGEDWLWWRAESTAGLNALLGNLRGLPELYAMVLVEHAQNEISQNHRRRALPCLVAAAEVLGSQEGADASTDRCLVIDANARLATLACKLNRYDIAENAAQTAVCFAQGSPPPAECSERIRTAACAAYRAESRLRWRDGSPDAALAALACAAAYREAALQADPGSIEKLLSLSLLHHRVGNLHLRHGDDAGAAEAFRQELAIVNQGLAEPHNENPSLLRRRAHAGRLLATCLQASEDSAGAIAALEQAVLDFERAKLNAEVERSVWLAAAEAWQDLARLYREAERPQEAADAYRSSIAVAARGERLLGGHSQLSDTADRGRSGLARVVAADQASPLQSGAGVDL
ncbi:Serine/threonine-protein kinase PrkC [Pirellulimonas nuda]|uniref:Serine/threonine-protein kinase PrkC n=1 Tax=Pirellulimonas nuda TaxID=2528009 RepID=A0A518DCK7_9BACT|nr:serine/threonine-protein kinase [Pirellulimonas nuda]QDU89214.1 Serine/threonine-protein kinase PrkC [Pirellulimonas nuda]